MVRVIGGTIAGVIAWLGIVTVLNLGLRYGWHDYHVVEKAMTFTLPMMLARLSESGVSSVVSGAIAAKLARNERAALYAGIALLAMFLPVHYMLFSKFPLWYHLVFLASLPLLSVLGGQLVRERSAAAQPA